jgi:hypothetical protein
VRCRRDTRHYVSVRDALPRARPAGPSHGVELDVTVGGPRERLPTSRAWWPWSLSLGCGPGYRRPTAASPTHHTAKGSRSAVGLVPNHATKFPQAGIYTEDQVRHVAELWVTRKGNNALSAAISPAQHDFARRYARAREEDDKVTLNALDLFRKDVSTSVLLVCLTPTRTTSERSTSAVAAGAVLLVGLTGAGVAAVDVLEQDREVVVGLRGPEGGDGRDGRDGVSGYDMQFVQKRWGPSTGRSKAQVHCHGGRAALGGGYDITPESEKIQRVDIIDDGPVSVSDANQRSVDDARPYMNGWRVSGDHNGQEVDVRVWAICAAVH